jgi:DNA-binding Lrp family transcriptional regulator
MAIKTVENQVPVEMDTIDKKIFYYLSQDIRYPKKNLAKKIRISPERLNYRIERFFDNLVEPICLLNFPLFQVSSYVIFIKEQLDKETISILEKQDEIYLLTQCVGIYHHVLHIVTNDLETFMQKNLPNISSYEVHEIKKYIPDNFNGFKIEEKPISDRKDSKINLTQAHITVLKELIKNPIESQLKISLNTGIDRRKVKTCFEDLYNNNYIQKFRFMLNAYKTPFQSYLLTIHFDYASKKNLINELRSDVFSGFIYESDGFMYMWYLPTNHQVLFNFVNKIETKFKSVKINTIQLTDLYLQNFMPKIFEKYL